MSLLDRLRLDRWSLLRLLRVLLPLALLALLGGALTRQYHQAWGQPRWLSDSTLVELGIAETLLQSKAYRLGDEGEVPGHAGALWHFVLRAGSNLWGSSSSAAGVITLFCCMGLMIASSRLLRDLYSGNIFVWGMMLSLAISPAFLDAITTQSASVLLLFCMLMAVKRHLDGFRRKAPILSPLVALYVGLSGLIQPGAILLYPMLVIHALLALPEHEREVRGRTVIAARGLVGFLAILLVLWPVMDLNIRILHKVLPTPPLLQAHGAAWVGWLGVERLQFLPIFLGLLALVATHLRSGREPIVTLLLILLPGSYFAEPLIARMGWRGGDAFRALLEPLLLLAVAWLLLAAFQEHFPKAYRGRAASAFTVSIIFLGTLFLSAKIELRKMAHTRENEAVLRDVFHSPSGNPDEVIATDIPGIAYQKGYRHILDLTGQTCADILRCIHSDRAFDPNEIIQFFKAHQPTRILLHSPELNWIQPRLQSELGPQNVQTSVYSFGDGSLQDIRLVW